MQRSAPRSRLVETEDVNACTDCHGERGAEPDRDKHPTLAGQVAAYTFKQLRDYKDGSRENRKMSEAVERLTDEQLAALAAWYADQPIPKVEVDEDDTVSEDTMKLVFRGDKTRLIQPCASCHGAAWRGRNHRCPGDCGPERQILRQHDEGLRQGKARERCL